MVAANPASFEGQVILAFLLLGVTPLLVFAARRMPAADLLWLVGISILALGAARFARPSGVLTMR